MISLDELYDPYMHKTFLRGTYLLRTATSIEITSRNFRRGHLLVTLIYFTCKLPKPYHSFLVNTFNYELRSDCSHNAIQSLSSKALGGLTALHILSGVNDIIEEIHIFKVFKPQQYCSHRK